MQRLDLGGVTASSVEELARIDFDIQNTTEIINPRQDVATVGSGFGDTATGVNFLSSRTNLRLLSKARMLQHTFFKPLSLIVLKYNKMMIDDEMYFRVSENPENPFKVVDPKTFTSLVDYRPTSAPEKITQDQKRNDLAYLIQTFGQIENSKPGTIDFTKFVPEVAKIAGFKNYNEFVLPPTTTILQLPDGNIVDSTGKPVEVVNVDEKGNPIEQGGQPVQ